MNTAELSRRPHLGTPISAAQGQLTGTLDYSIIASTTAQCRAQGFSRDPDGRLVPFSRTFAHTSGDRTVENGVLLSDTRHPILSLDIGAVPDNIKRGEIYVRINVTAQTISIPLCRGYVYSENPLTLGEFIEPGPGGGSGNLRRLESAEPAAGAEVGAFIVPTNALWKPHLFSVTMAQGITQTPRPTLQFQDTGGGRVRCRVPMPADVAASTTVRCSWGRGGPETANNIDTGEMTAVMPDTLMEEAEELATLTRGIGANSDYGVAQLLIEEWLVS